MPDAEKSTLLLRISAPMQAWGSNSLFEIRDTLSEPTKSGIIGLLGCACGRKRDDVEFIAKCCQLSMGVLVVKEGKHLWDYQVSGGGTWKNKPYGVACANGKNTGSPVLSRRCYLSDADFIVSLTGETDLINMLESGLKKPVWPIYLGRKSFPPAAPIFLTRTTDTDIEKALLKGLLQVVENENWLADNKTVNQGKEFKPPDWVQKIIPKDNHVIDDDSFVNLRMVIECTKNEGNPVEDAPITFEKLYRKYSRRYIKNDYVSTSRILEDIHARSNLPDKA